jgi:hypothetical protein
MGAMNKLIRDGKVAVLISPGFGAGWSTWNQELPEMLFDSGMAGLVLVGDKGQMRVYASIKWPGAYLGGLEDLAVEWVDQGQLIKINESDGSESIEYRDRDNWITV